MMGNKGAGGPFAPIVVLTRNIVGEKDFNQIRGKAISLHSQGTLACVWAACACLLARIHGQRLTSGDFHAQGFQPSNLQ